MVLKNTKSNIILVISLVFIILIGAVTPSVSAGGDSTNYKGFSKGIPWQPFEQLKTATFVGFDKDSYNDDYAYFCRI